MCVRGGEERRGGQWGFGVTHLDESCAFVCGQLRDGCKDGGWEG